MATGFDAGKITPEETTRKASATNKKAEKREIAKAKILNATLDIIAKKGLAALSHRSIASAAGVQLAMTTYYFGTIDNILVAAFREFVKSMEPVNADLIRRGDAFLAQLQGADGTVKDCERYIEGIADIFAQMIDSGLSSRRDQLRIESQYLFEQHPSEALAEEIQAYNDWLADIALRFIRPIGAQDPELDAQLFLWTVQCLDFSNVSSVQVKGPSSRDVLLRLMRGFCV
ncbi:TetR family transcriptional regulator [Microbulbifer salipaludis]|uniref:TetR family transcriptional regulator n=1 Tax=Microbulbifer salipaludis TaxID=187980 RepID=A0ABS3E3W3_9GAMM|nr:TetR family transcriptional regulator [Microbulbifer salipaludis]MBN8429997.1 TetR family transcriptional regulator [Microbulbifer salipaludis]